MRTIRILTWVLTSLSLAAGSALAKLPPPAPDVAAAAAAVKDKTAWSDKVAAYQLCLAQDRLAQQYRKTKEGAKPQTVATPPCTDPGPYVPTATAASDPATAPATSPGSAAAPASAPAAAPAPNNAAPAAPAKK